MPNKRPTTASLAGRKGETNKAPEVNDLHFPTPHASDLVMAPNPNVAQQLVIGGPRANVVPAANPAATGPVRTAPVASSQGDSPGFFPPLPKTNAVAQANPAVAQQLVIGAPKPTALASSMPTTPASGTKAIAAPTPGASVQNSTSPFRKGFFQAATDATARPRLASLPRTSPQPTLGTGLTPLTVSPTSVNPAGNVNLAGLPRRRNQRAVRRAPDPEDIFG